MKLLRRQSGDTLVEVTFALALLSAVLASAFTVANLTQRIVAAAKERTFAIGLAQEQAEALHAYRDKDLSSAGQPSIGSAFGYTPLQCTVLGSTPIYHMEPGATNSGWIPKVNPINKNTLYTVQFTACPMNTLLNQVVGVHPYEYEFTITVKWISNIPGPPHTATVVTRLADLQGMAPIDCSDANTGAC